MSNEDSSPKVRLEDLTPGVKVRGLYPSLTVTIVVNTPQSENSFLIIARIPDGSLDEQIYGRGIEGHLEIAEDLAWSLDANGLEFKLAAEARRIHLAPFFDPYVMVDASNIDPLPHQIDAVYLRMLPLQPLRFLLADDPGAGKTIMSGLLIRELMARGDAARILIVAPGSLVEQWQTEMQKRFNLSFEIVDRDFPDLSPIHRPLLIARMDQSARNEEISAALKDIDWDLVVVDEAHKMSASLDGESAKKTLRYRLGEMLQECTRHFLLLTATPHSGDKTRYQLFLSLLDPDRFRVVDGSTNTPTHEDIIRRVVKENLLTFEGTRLFPERKSYSLHYQLSPAEMKLYETVTDYVSHQMDRAKRLQEEGDKRRGLAMGFVLAALQRRLASSPYAILRSLQRRKERLEKKLEEYEKANPDEPQPKRSTRFSQLSDSQLEQIDTDEFHDEEMEEIIDEAFDDDTTIPIDPVETKAEIEILGELIEYADGVYRQGTDAKWSELSKLLGSNQMFAKDGSRRKLIIFTEHKDTLEYLVKKIRKFLGDEKAVVQIHGGMQRGVRLRVQEAFIHDPDIWILVATDAAGEGVNLQRANLMVNYDLPWNPNRLEQRFGRIHRIGQTEVCHLWNLIAYETREGQVYDRLLKKMEEMRTELGDQIYDVLGEAFEDTPLQDMLIEAIQYGEQPAVQQRLFEVIDEQIGQKTKEIIQTRSAYIDRIGEEDIASIHLEMERSRARKLQPSYIENFVRSGLTELGGRIAEREKGRFQITRVPPALRFNLQPRYRIVIPSVYERVTFRKELVDPDPDRKRQIPAELIVVGHPLLTALVETISDQYENLLQQGTILVNPLDEGTEPRLLVFLEHTIDDGRGKAVSKEMQFVSIDQQGDINTYHNPPYIDYRPLAEGEWDLLSDQLDRSWITDQLTNTVKEHAVGHLATKHFQEVSSRIIPRVAMVRKEVKERLQNAINLLDIKANEAKQRELEFPDKKGGYHSSRFRERADELEQRLQERMAELDLDENLANRLPVITGVALIIPQGLMDQLTDGNGEPQPQPPIDTKTVDQIAVAAVMECEQLLKRNPTEMAHHNPGYDIESFDEKNNRHLFIEVKGRIEGRNEVSVSATQIHTSHNVPETFILALVKVPTEEGEVPQVRYLRHPFQNQQIGPNVTKITFDLAQLWDDAEEPS